MACKSFFTFSFEVLKIICVYVHYRLRGRYSEWWLYLTFSWHFLFFCLCFSLFISANMEYMLNCNHTQNAVCKCKAGYECKDQACKQCSPVQPTIRPMLTRFSTGGMILITVLAISPNLSRPFPPHSTSTVMLLVKDLVHLFFGKGRILNTWESAYDIVKGHLRTNHVILLTSWGQTYSLTEPRWVYMFRQSMLFLGAILINELICEFYTWPCLSEILPPEGQV